MMTLEINGVITGYCIHVGGGFGIMTSRPQLRGDTGDSVLVHDPIGSREAVSRCWMWCCCWPVIIFNRITFTVTFTYLSIYQDINLCLGKPAYCTE